MSKPLKPITVEFPDYPNPEVLHMLLHMKGGPMKDRRKKREGNKKNSWREEY